MGRTLPPASAIHKHYLHRSHLAPHSRRTGARGEPLRGSISLLRAPSVRSIVRPVKRKLLPAGFAAIAALMVACPAHALRFQERPDWMFGVGYGYGTGQFENGNDTSSEYRGGAAPQVHFGRMLSTHWMASVNWQQWLTELGDVPFKYRRSLQNLALGIAYFPGDPSGPVYGMFFRAGAGMGWAGTGRKDAVPGEAQHKGERIDEWGIGVFAEAGYEFWITPRVTAGLMVNYNWFDIQETIVERAKFGAGVALLNAYW